MSDEHVHGQDIIIAADGSQTYQDPFVVQGDVVLRQPHSGSICVHEGANFTIARSAQHSGSLHFRRGSTGRIEGSHAGSLHMAADVTVEVQGNQSGSAHVAAGAVLTVAPDGQLAGSLHIDGLVTNAGVRGGSLETGLGGEVRDLPGSRVKQPVRNSEGMVYYQW